MIIDASVWGRTLKGVPPSSVLPNVKHLTVHYVGSPSVGVSEANVAGFIKNIERGQMAKDPAMSAISYNFLIDKYGRVWEGRGFSYRNAANGAGSNNATSLSVCVLVGVNDNNPTGSILFALRVLWKHCLVRCLNIVDVQGHRDVRATACPGDALYKLVSSGLVVGDGNVSRVDGPNRYATNVAVSEQSFPNGCSTVVVASGEGFPDALSAQTLATSLKAPVLLVPKDSLPSVTANEIKRLKAQHVRVVGGPSAVSDRVVAEISLLLTK
jgi:hypothetical protein